MAKVTMIPATIDPITRIPTTTKVKRRVAAYARVSTDREEQLTSYEAQVDYYTHLIQGKSEWKYAGIYTDEGITGTNTNHRDGFNQMVEDALAGQIDLIITKSISRFARNTVDSLTTIRKLKARGVEVYFEKENIYTFDGKGELYITLMSSLAQEESRSISENITWGKRKRFADGQITLPYKHFLGYRKGADGLPEIVPEEAALVRRIYTMFIDGKTPYSIAKALTEEGVPTPGGKTVWQATTIRSILTNEKYSGSAILQKRFTVDFLTKTMKVNEGEIPQYYVEQSHKPIIDPEEWKLVQNEIAHRQTVGSKYSGNHVFATKIMCGDCGAFFGSKVWNSTNSKYRKVIWQCNDKFKGNRRCTTPHISEEELKSRFVQAFNMLCQAKSQVLEDCRAVADRITDCTELDAKKLQLEQEVEVVVQLMQNAIRENAEKAQNQTDYLEKYNGYVARYEALSKKLNAVIQEISARMTRADAIVEFLQTFEKAPGALLEFDEKLWLLTIDKVKVMQDGKLVFLFQSGNELSV